MEVVNVNDLINIPTMNEQGKTMPIYSTKGGQIYKGKRFLEKWYI